VSVAAGGRAVTYPEAGKDLCAGQYIGRAVQLGVACGSCRAGLPPASGLAWAVANMDRYAGASGSRPGSLIRPKCVQPTGMKSRTRRRSGADWKGLARRDGQNLATPGKADTVGTEKLGSLKDARPDSDLIAAWGITIWLGEPA